MKFLKANLLFWIFFLFSQVGLAQAHTLLNFPQGKNGKFDASLDQDRCELTITVRVCFDFVDGKSRSRQWPNQAARDSFKSGYLSAVPAHWSGKFVLKPTKGTKVPCEQITVVVRVIEDNENPHFKLKVRYYEKHQDSKTKNRKTVKLDNRDLEERSRSVSGKKYKQTGALHEFGHMIGLGDNTSTEPPASIMNSGNQVLPQHYQTFGNAVSTMTGGGGWQGSVP